VRHDRPSFDDFEAPPVVTTPIDGLTDEQWAARRQRGERIVRVVCGFPEWKIVESLPLWAIGLVGIASIALLAFVASLFVIGYFPAVFR
jgi:hypothetical protein